MRFQSYFNTALKIIELYDGAIPLSYFLNKYFSQNKKHGSKDRKFITHACYNYYRIGRALNNLNNEQRLKAAVFLCNDSSGEWKILYDGLWLNNWNKVLEKRIAFIKTKYFFFNIEDIFAFTTALSDEVNTTAFIKSHLIQPDVFLRIRKNYYDVVTTKLKQHEIFYKEIEENCIAVLNSTKTDAIINIDEEAVIQDFSSQRIKKFLKIMESEIQNQKSKINTWDCCAGSGGKSILAYDVLQNIHLTVSDVRASIIHNLKERFSKAGIKNYKSVVGDITNSMLQIPGSLFDLIICDAPCSGSGTWSRTPEQLYFFDEGKIEIYFALQKKIISNAIKHLKPGGFFLYITCSVFKKENENIVEFLNNFFNVTALKTELLKGYNKKANTIFAALFKLNIPV